MKPEDKEQALREITNAISSSTDKDVRGVIVMASTELPNEPDKFCMSVFMNATPPARNEMLAALLYEVLSNDPEALPKVMKLVVLMQKNAHNRTTH